MKKLYQWLYPHMLSTDLKRFIFFEKETPKEEFGFFGVIHTLMNRLSV